ncbi:MAG: CpXC domain-containing protein [Anaerolineales bacterium]
MPKVQTRCPNCQQPMVAEVTQVLNVRENPQVKQRLLSGLLNVNQCPHCGFQGQIPVPIVYHDPKKELLLTFNPPDPNLSMEEREGKMAPLLKKVTESLPPEERKGYLFQPQTMMTMDSLIKNVLKEDGVTEEMIEEQQKRVELLEQLLTVEGAAQVDLIHDNEEIIDREFFAIFSQIAQRLVASEDDEIVRKIQALQDQLLSETEIGREIKRETEELQKARTTLEKIGQNLTRSKLLELVIHAPNEERVKAFAGLARPAMDYQFFQMFTDEVEKSEGERRKKLVERRNILLKITKEIDREVEERLADARRKIEDIINAEAIPQAVMNYITSMDEFFIEALSSEIESAKAEDKPERLEKLEEILSVIEEISTPAEFKLMDEFLEAAEDEEVLKKKVNEHSDRLTEGFVNKITNILNQVERRLDGLEGEEKERQEDLLNRLEKVHQTILRRSMEKKFKEE